MKNTYFTLFTVAAGLIRLSVGLAADSPISAPTAIVVPNAFATAPANSGAGLEPFGTFIEVYSSSEFGAIGDGALINSISFRAEEDAGASFDATYSELSVEIATF